MTQALKTVWKLSPWFALQRMIVGDSPRIAKEPRFMAFLACVAIVFFFKGPAHWNWIGLVFVAPRAVPPILGCGIASAMWVLILERSGLYQILGSSVADLVLLQTWVPLIYAIEGRKTAEEITA